MRRRISAKNRLKGNCNSLVLRDWDIFAINSEVLAIVFWRSMVISSCSAISLIWLPSRPSSSWRSSSILVSSLPWLSRSTAKVNFNKGWMIRLAKKPEIEPSSRAVPIVPPKKIHFRGFRGAKARSRSKEIAVPILSWGLIAPILIGA